MKNTRDKRTIIFVSILVVIVLGVYATLVVYHSTYFTQQYEGYFEFINENDLQVSCEIDQAFTSSKDFAIRPLREKLIKQDLNLFQFLEKRQFQAVLLWYNQMGVQTSDKVFLALPCRLS